MRLKGIQNPKSKAQVVVYRIQDAAGRGPYRPGFSDRWIDDSVDERTRLPGFMEMGMAVLNKRFTWEHVGFAFRSLEDLKGWFTALEIKRLKGLGYRVVKLEADRILGESPKQLLFARKRALAMECEVCDEE